MSSLKEMLDSELYNIKNLRYLHILYQPDRCIGCWECYEVCPVSRWTPDYEVRFAVLYDERFCVACGACVLQCPEDAIRLATRKGSNGNEI